MDQYWKLVEALERGTKAARCMVISRENAPNSAINELAFYLYRNGVRVVGGEEDESERKES